eukprot:7185404-Pyramimonas_sp.AAC.1
MSSRSVQEQKTAKMDASISPMVRCYATDGKRHDQCKDKHVNMQLQTPRLLVALLDARCAVSTS